MESPEQPRSRHVVVGVDTHKDIHVAAVMDPLVGIVGVPRQVVGRISSASKVGMVGSASPWWTSAGLFQAIAS
ncbi:hypothetical protein Lsed01_00971 [Demequina sediminis]|uniref:Transposase n=1 Tax=Demequina sediminis TaxID=1930058 RepID=A0ABP9WFF0_9MICO|nr:hypothetical protein GCM10025873_21570 [Demequina sediminis]